MPSRIGVFQRIIANIAIPIPALRVRRTRNNRICAQKVVNIRRIGLPLDAKECAEPARAPPNRH